MKQKTINKTITLLLFCTFLLSATSLSAQEKKSFGEIGAGLFNVQGGVYKTLSEKSVVGVHAYTGFVFPALFAQLSPQYKYYFNGITTRENRGSFIAVSGLNMMALNDMHAGSDKKWNVAFYANVGIGYEWNLRNFIIRPTISVGVPITRIAKKDSYAESLLGYSMYSFIFQTLSVSYRF